MATYTQQCSSVGGYGYAKNYSLYVILNDRDGNSGTNRSYVDYNVYAQSSGSGWFTGTHRRYFSINGSTIIDVTQSITTSSPNGYVPIASGTIEVLHENDGTKVIPFSAQIQATNYGIAATISGSFRLNDIPRYANLTSLSVKNRTINTVTLQYTTDRPADLYCSIDGGGTWLNNGGPFVSNTTSGEFTVSYKDRGSTQRLDPNTSYTFRVLCRAVDSRLDTTRDVVGTTIDIARVTSAPNINIGESHTIEWNNPMGTEISLKLCKPDNSTLEDYGKVEGTSKTITPKADDIYKLTPNSNTITLKYAIVTVYNGETYTSYKDCIFTVTDSNPTFSNFVYEDSNSITLELTGNAKTIVKGHSTVKVTISPTNKAVAKNYATMLKYRLSIGDKVDEKPFSDTEDVVLEVSNAESNTITVYAIDSRENSVSKQILADNYIAYESIKIAAMSVTRKNDVGSETTLNFSGYIWNSTFGKVSNDIITCIYKYKKTTSEEWTEGTTKLEPNKSGNSFSFIGAIAGDIGAEGFDIDESYNFEVYISDRLTNNDNNPATFILGPGIPAIALYKNSVAIGQKYDIEDLINRLQVNGNSRFNGDIIIHGGINSNDSGKVLFGYTLYENESGTTGAITLSESAENFKYIDIFFLDYDNQAGFQRVYLPNGKTISMVSCYVDVASNVVWMKTDCITISETSLSRTRSAEAGFRTDKTFQGVNINNGNYTKFKILKIVGYK